MVEDNIAKQVTIDNDYLLVFLNENGDEYLLSEVIIGYGEPKYNELYLKSYTSVIISSNKEFNKKFHKFSKNGISY